MSVGIVGVGAYLPPKEKLNDEWSAEVTQRWQRSSLLTHVQNELDPQTEGERLVAEAILSEKNDPFRGARKRRVADPETVASDMEARAAQLALVSAGVDASDIDLLLVHSVVPDFLQTPNACKLQTLLGIPKKCFALDMESVCNSFHHQVEIARSLIGTGRARRALLIQSCLYTRLIPHSAPHSAWFGDGASAQVLAADDGATILGQAHRTDGEFDGTIVATVPGKRWYDDGRTEWSPLRKELATKFITSVADLGRETTHAALAEAELSPDDVDFYASHQGTSWFRKVTQRAAGLHRARGCDTYHWTGSLASANVPFVLACGSREGTLRDGDVVAAYSGGSGISWSSTVMRWKTPKNQCHVEL